MERIQAAETKTVHLLQVEQGSLEQELEGAQGSRRAELESSLNNVKEALQQRPMLPEHTDHVLCCDATSNEGVLKFQRVLFSLIKSALRRNTMKEAQAKKAVAKQDFV